MSNIIYSIFDYIYAYYYPPEYLFEEKKFSIAKDLLIELKNPPKLRPTKIKKREREDELKIPISDLLRYKIQNNRKMIDEN